MAEFCQACGTKYVNNLAKFCHNCGAHAPRGDCPTTSTTISTPKPVPKSTPKSTLSYEDFRKRTKTTRTKKILSGKKAKTDEEVKIQVGVVEADDEKLKRLKGRTLPLMIGSSCHVQDLLQAAVEKQAKHFKQFNKQSEHILLYPDHSIVQKLPGSSDDFVLSEYKKDLGKPYSKIYFYLCSTLDFERSKQSSESDEDNSVFYDEEKKELCQDGKVDTVIKISDDENESKSKEMACCPTCFNMFSLHEIEAHANDCADIWIDPIGDISEDDLEEYFYDNPSICTNEDEDANVSHGDPMQKIKQLVTELADNVDPGKTRINVRRKSVFEDYLDLAKKKWFNPKQLLKVTFIGEPAIDDGGPRREFFSEVLQSIQRQLFEDGLPLPDMAALGNNKFKVAGELMAGSIVQGGPAPRFLSKEAYGYMVEGIASITIDQWVPQIKEKRLKEAINKIRRCTTDGNLCEVLLKEDMLDVLAQIHYRGVPSKESLDSVDNILRPIVMYDFARHLPMMDQLITGLSSFGIIDAARENKVIMEALFVAKHSTNFVPTADQLLDSIDGAFSEDGSNHKEKEIDIYKLFCDFLQDSDELQDTSGSSKLCMLHKFITGSEQIPPLGLPKRITVKFKHGCREGCRCRPTASTCDPSITIPIHYDNYNQLNESLQSSIIEGLGFGLI